ncbi:MAG: membrane protein [Candidatus Bathyarchaeota archaeon]
MDTPRNTSEVVKRLPILFSGYFLCSLGIVANLYANLGTSPWTLFHVGLTNITGLTLGQITQIVGLIIILISWKLGNSPGIGTIANMIFIGFFIDLIIFARIIPFQTELFWQIFQLILSILIIGLGALFYLGTQLGAGPRDGLMVVLTRVLDKPVSFVRVPMDVLVSVLGYFLGGPLGLGTIFTAFGLGYSMQFFFKIGKFDSRSKQLSLLELIKTLNLK